MVRYQWIDGACLHDAIEDIEGEFETYLARSMPTFLHRSDLDLQTLIDAGEQ